MTGDPVERPPGGPAPSAGALTIDGPPLPFASAVQALGRSALRTGSLLGSGSISQPKRRLGWRFGFADGTHGRVYRETVVSPAPTDQPAVLVVSFRLRAVRGRAHGLFRAESLLNTPLFAGFPGLVSKLWLSHDERDRYRGIYQWNDPELADSYVRALWWALAAVSETASIASVVVPGHSVDEVLSDPLVLDRVGARHGGWWRPTAIETT